MNFQEHQQIWKQHIKGIGLKRNKIKGLMNLAKAASLGHPIAKKQIAIIQLRKNSD